MLTRKKSSFFLIGLPLFCAGIFLQWKGCFSLTTLICLLFISSILLLISILRHKTRLGAIGMTGFLLALGGTLCRISDKRSLWTNPDIPPENGFLLLQVNEPAVEKSSSYKLACELIASGNAVTAQPAAGQIWVYLKKDYAPVPKYGQRFILAGRPERIVNAGNPGGFDFQEWADRKGIYYQIRCSGNALQILPGFYGNGLREKLYVCAEALLKHIRTSIPEPSAAGIAQALLIGYRAGIDNELNEAYTRTGVVHIVAISGMHLSMIFGLLAILPFRKQNRVAFLFRNILIASTIWLFTFLAGAAPSIMRAAVMLTLTLIAQSFGRRTDSINTLLASAFLLLLADPINLWDIGFQLSYTAVGGLILFSKKLEEWFRFKHPFLMLLWQMQTISISAQILTTPLVLYHFHQFPVLFLLTNMVAVPVSGFILYLEILLCLLMVWPEGALFFGKLITFLLDYMNNYIILLSNLSWCTAEGFNIGALQVAALFSLIFFADRFFVKRKLASAIGAILCVAVIAAARSLAELQANQQRILVVYHIPGSASAELIWGRKAIRFCDNSKMDPRSERKTVLPSHCYFRIRDIESAEICSEILVCSTGLGTVNIVTGNPIPKADLIENQTDIVVLSGSMSKTRAARWKEICKGKGIAVHDVREKGAFVISLN